MKKENKVYHRKSKEWDYKSCVRSNAEVYDLNLSTENSNVNHRSWHLPSYSGILEHEGLSSLKEEEKEFVRGLQLLEFVTKQAVFEVDCVNDVASRIAFEKYDFLILSLKC